MYNIYTCCVYIYIYIILMFFLPVSFLSKPIQIPNLELHCPTTLYIFIVCHTSRVPSGVNNHSPFGRCTPVHAGKPAQLHI